MNTEDKTLLLPLHKSLDMDTPTQLSAPHGGFKITDLTVNIPSSLQNTLSSTPGKRPAPSRWGTLEFKVYYLVFMAVIPIMIWIPVSLSSRRSFYLPDNMMVSELTVIALHPNFPFYWSKLEHGWIPGRSVVRSACGLYDPVAHIPCILAGQ